VKYFSLQFRPTGTVGALPGWEAATVAVQMHDDRDKNHQAYLWQYSNPAGPVVFDFRLGREREVPKRFLGNFEGLLQSDGYGAYDHIGGPKIVHASCGAVQLDEILDLGGDNCFGFRWGERRIDNPVPRTFQADRRTTQGVLSNVTPVSATVCRSTSSSPKIVASSMSIHPCASCDYFSTSSNVPSEYNS
jgi:Transposase IS66 family